MELHHIGKNCTQLPRYTIPSAMDWTDGPLAWPPRSPDLTPLDFFLWGYVKDKVFASKITDITQLKTRIIEVIENISQSMLTSTWNEIEYRLDVT
ncbi:hypothetical protein AVEN_145767-1 [Araneus ventricosus]|uniref:Transposable element Tc1 transposase n=1 Tax=Araneus ventricosus TaxID=182803 RepID=A0A4Y2IRG4_ARAVE|nr:hypothetical protein AVEN_145767-1 [Araneus ventricosus]